MTIKQNAKSTCQPRGLRLLLIVSCMSLLTNACTEYRLVQSDDGKRGVTTLAVGDTVEVVTVDATKLEFKISAIEEDALLGDNVRVPIEDVRTISVRQLNVGRSRMALVAIVLTAASIYALQSIPPGWPPPAGGG